MSGPVRFTPDELTQMAKDPAITDGIIRLMHPQDQETLMKLRASPAAPKSEGSWLPTIGKVAGGVTGAGLMGALAPETGGGSLAILPLLLESLGMAGGTLAGDAAGSIISGQEMSPKSDLATGAIPFAGPAAGALSRVSPKLTGAAGSAIGGGLGLATGHPFIGMSAGGAIGGAAPAAAKGLSQIMEAISPGQVTRRVLGKGSTPEMQVDPASLKKFGDGIGSDPGEVIRGAQPAGRPLEVDRYMPNRSGANPLPNGGPQPRHLSPGEEQGIQLLDDLMNALGHETKGNGTFRPGAAGPSTDLSHVPTSPSEFLNNMFSKRSLPGDPLPSFPVHPEEMAPPRTLPEPYPSDGVDLVRRKLAVLLNRR